MVGGGCKHIFFYHQQYTGHDITLLDKYIVLKSDELAYHTLLSLALFSTIPQSLSPLTRQELSHAKLCKGITSK